MSAADLPLALASFNAGVELGQLAFVAALLLLSNQLSRRLPGLRPRITPPMIYAIGILAAFWCYERLALWLA